jgi:hypothetical protein
MKKKIAAIIQQFKERRDTRRAERIAIKLLLMHLRGTPTMQTFISRGTILRGFHVGSIIASGNARICATVIGNVRLEDGAAISGGYIAGKVKDATEYNAI